MRRRRIVMGIALLVWIALSGLSLAAAGPKLLRQGQCEGAVGSASCPDSALHQPSGYVLESLPQGSIQTDSETHQPSNYVLPSPAGPVLVDSMRPDG